MFAIKCYFVSSRQPSGRRYTTHIPISQQTTCTKRGWDVFGRGRGRGLGRSFRLVFSWEWGSPSWLVLVLGVVGQGGGGEQAMEEGLDLNLLYHGIASLCIMEYRTPSPFDKTNTTENITSTRRLYLIKCSRKAHNIFAIYLEIRKLLCTFLVFPGINIKS